MRWSSACGLVALLGMLGITGAFAHALPWYARSWAAQTTMTPRGAPLFPLGLAGSVLGILLFTMIGALMGATRAGEALLGDDRFGCVLLGSIVGLLPVGLWWVYVRRRAGKSIRAVVAVLVVCLSLTGMEGLIAFRAGSWQSGRDYHALVTRGYQRYDRGSLESAIADCNTAIALNPKKYSAYWLRGLALLGQGKDAEAQRDFERCVQRRPDLKQDLEEMKKRRTHMFD
jgi:tetratricopeptide (TPR) repeat protein